MRPPARLLLEDGTVFCDRQVGGDQRGDGGRRSGVQHGDDWLPGDIDRSVLPTADYYLDLPVCRQRRDKR